MKPASWKCIILGPIPDFLNQNLSWNPILRRIICMLKLRNTEKQTTLIKSDVLKSYCLQLVGNKKQIKKLISEIYTSLEESDQLENS